MGDGGRFRCVKGYGGGGSTDGWCEGPDSYGRGQEGHGDNHIGLPSSYLRTHLDRHLDWWVVGACVVKDTILTVYPLRIQTLEIANLLCVHLLLVS